MFYIQNALLEFGCLGIILRSLQIISKFQIMKIFQIIQGNIQDSSLIKDLSKRAEMMVFLDSEMKTRWLLDQNFELTYRQNDILIYRKLT